jgi:hypothetical protein
VQHGASQETNNSSASTDTNLLPSVRNRSVELTDGEGEDDVDPMRAYEATLAKMMPHKSRLEAVVKEAGYSTTEAWCVGLLGPSFSAMLMFRVSSEHFLLI